MSGPCGWVISECGCGSCWGTHKPADREQATTLAAHLMWAATGRRYGLCEVTVLPCNPRPPAPLYEDYGGGGYDPYGPGPTITGGVWRNSSCGGGCTCAAACELRLNGPVATIIEVVIDGEIVDPSAYQVHDRALLVRVDGQCWPTCQTMGQEVPGFQVTLEVGLSIPPAVQYAFRILACQFAAACAGGECSLPARMTSLSRQGVEVSIAEIDLTRPGQFRTGIPQVDDVIAADNPYGLIESPGVWSPDLAESRHRTVTWAGGS